MKPEPEYTIYHNPACGTSRNVLAALRAAGIAPRVVEYLKTPPSSGGAGGPDRADGDPGAGGAAQAGNAL